MKNHFYQEPSVYICLFIFVWYFVQVTKFTKLLMFTASEPGSTPQVLELLKWSSKFLNLLSHVCFVFIL